MYVMNVWGQHSLVLVNFNVRSTGNQETTSEISQSRDVSDCDSISSAF